MCCISFSFYYNFPSVSQMYQTVASKLFFWGFFLHWWDDFYLSINYSSCISDTFCWPQWLLWVWVVSQGAIFLQWLRLSRLTQLSDSRKGHLIQCRTCQLTFSETSQALGLSKWSEVKWKSMRFPCHPMLYYFTGL